MGVEGNADRNYRTSTVFPCAAAIAVGWCISISPAIAQTPPPLISADLVVGGMSGVVAITHAGDDRLFITEQAGRIRIVDLSTTPPTLLATPFLDINDIVRAPGDEGAGGEEGLLSVAFDPDYATNGFFYVYYTNTSSNNVVASYSVSADRDIALQVGTPLLTIPHPGASNHNGGQLQFGHDGFLYVATGDGGGGNDASNNAQNRNVLLGKLLRLDVNGPAPYAVPPGNPFVDDEDAMPEIWAYGLRNPFRFTVDRQTGDLFIGDVGQGAREEVDLAPVGAGGLNFGWRVMEGTRCTNLAQLNNPPCNHASLVLPILEYPNPTDGPSSVIAGQRYRGTRLISPGTYLYADFYSGVISQGQEDANGDWTSSPLRDTPFFVSAFGEDKSGEIYITEYSGSLYRLNPTDSDTDGLPNWWEAQHFGGSTTAAVPSEDSDGDGFTNAQEFNGGTDPRSGASALRAATAANEEGTFVLRFPTVFGKRYQAEFKNELTTVMWSSLGDPFSGTGDEEEVRDPFGTEDERFYRVRLLP